MAADLFDNLVFAKEDVIHFPDGIPGFDDMKDFVLVSLPEHEPFEWMVCTSNPRLRFAVINPLLFLPDYNPKISKEQFAPLGVDKPDDLLLLVIITLKDPLTASTANCIGPVFINRNKRIGKQIVLDSDRYSVQEPIIRNE